MNYLARGNLQVCLTLKQGNSDVKTRLLAFDLDLWPTTLTYNPNLVKVMVNLHTEYQGRSSNGSAVRVSADRQMDGRYQIHYLPRFVVDNSLTYLFLWKEC